MSSAVETVRDFIEAVNGPGGYKAAFDRFFTDATLWENHGLQTTTGIAEALALMDQFGEQMGVREMRFDALAIAVDGNKVLTERIDRMLDGDGKEVGAFPVMGIFEIEDGKIAAWRDYFDTAGFVNG